MPTSQYHMILNGELETSNIGRVSYIGVLGALIGLVLFSFSVFVFANDQQEAVRAVVIWHEVKDQSYHVMVSERDDEVWLPPQTIAQSDNPITTPAVSILKDETLLAVWSQQAFGAVRLMSATKRKNDKFWSAEQILYSDGAWNMNPSLLKDGVGDLWLFWSSSADGDTDIYTMKKSDGSSWSSVQRVHKNNDVPDRKPQARLSEAGNIQLQWSHLNEKARRYETAELELAVPGSESSILQTRKPKDETTDLVLPKFLPQTTSGMLLFKDNIYYQSRRLD